jgi:tetratricopeptide (TPR) repeat protein
LSRAYYTQAGYGWAPVADGFERARDAAKQALALAPDLAEGHVCLGNVLEGYDWNWKAANAEYQRALVLEPNNVNVLRAVAGMTRIFGGAEPAIDLLRKAAELDPLSSSAQRILGLRCFLVGRYDEAMAALEVALDLNPKSGLVHCFMCATRLAQGHAAEALELAQRETLPDFRLVGIALAQHTLGNKEASDAALQELGDKHGNEAAYQFAEACAWRGEIDRAFEWLERAYTQRDPGLAISCSDPFFRPLHDDPRWVPFMRKMGFP